MADTSFQHHGHQVEIKVWQTEPRWGSSFQINDRLPVEMFEPGRTRSFCESKPGCGVFGRPALRASSW